MKRRLRGFVFVGCILMAAALGAGIGLAQPWSSAALTAQTHCDVALTSVLAVNDLGPKDPREGALATDCTVTELEPAIAGYEKAHPVNHLPGPPLAAAHTLAGWSCIGFPHDALCRGVGGAA